MTLNLPNILTLLRIALTPVFIILLFYDHPYAKLWALGTFIVASITDAFDGYYARRNNEITDHGRFLDPLADKILVSSALISFAVLDVIPYWMVASIIFRDMFVTGLRVVMKNKGLTLITSNIAKTKTTVQVVIIVSILIYLGISSKPLYFLYNYVRMIENYNLIYLLALLATIFTVYTGFSYLYNNRSSLRQFLS